VLGSLCSGYIVKPDYKRLYRTHIHLQNRFLSASYRLSPLQTKGSPPNAHTNTIYCLQLYTYPSTGVQVLFTGSKDKTIREWNLRTGLVERVISGVHTSSILSLCVHNGMLATAGSDKRVVVWDLEKNKLVKVIMDHDDSVLCVRFDDDKLVSCSKGMVLLYSNGKP
jgi:WD40 repeat protein